MGGSGPAQGDRQAPSAPRAGQEAVPALRHCQPPLSPRAARRLLRLIGVKFNLQQSAGGEAGAELARRGALASAQAPSPAGRRRHGVPCLSPHPNRDTRAGQGCGAGSGRSCPRPEPREPRRVSYGVAGCAHILIRKNNNLSKIHMICVFFPDRIYIGIIHQLGLALARREKEEKKKVNKKKSRQKNPLGSECCLPAGSFCSEPCLAGTPRLLHWNLDCIHRDAVPRAPRQAGASTAPATPGLQRGVKCE